MLGMVVASNMPVTSGRRLRPGRPAISLLGSFQAPPLARCRSVPPPPLLKPQPSDRILLPVMSLAVAPQAFQVLSVHIQELPTVCTYHITYITMVQ